MLSTDCFVNGPATPQIYTLSLHDALPIFAAAALVAGGCGSTPKTSEERGRDAVRFYKSGVEKVNTGNLDGRSEEHTSELQSRVDLVCRLLLEKKKTDIQSHLFIRN